MTGQPPWAALALAFNAFVWGISWWPLRHLQDAGLHPLWATAVIYLLCSVGVAAWRPGAVWEVLSTPAMWVLVVAAGVTNASFNWAVTVGDVVRVVLLFYLMPAWAVILARLVLGEPITASALLRVALAMAGAAIVLGVGDGRWPVPRSLVEWLAVLGGLSFALNNVMLRRLASQSAPARTFAMFAGGVPMAALAAIGLAGPQAAWPSAWSWPLVLGVLALCVLFLAGNAALQYGATRLAAHTTAVIMLLEVFFASASALLLGATQPDARVWAGGALIVAAALLAARSR